MGNSDHGLLSVKGRIKLGSDWLCHLCGGVTLLNGIRLDSFFLLVIYHEGHARRTYAQAHCILIDCGKGSDKGSWGC